MSMRSFKICVFPPLSFQYLHEIHLGYGIAYVYYVCIVVSSLDPLLLLLFLFLLLCYYFRSGQTAWISYLPQNQLVESFRFKLKDKMLF